MSQTRLGEDVMCIVSLMIWTANRNDINRAIGRIAGRLEEDKVRKVKSKSLTISLLFSLGLPAYPSIYLTYLGSHRIGATTNST